MPTVLSDEGFAVRVYLNDHEPAHVHVWKGGGWILLSLPTERIPVAVLRTSGMKQADMVRAFRLVERMPPPSGPPGDDTMVKKLSDADLLTELGRAKTVGRQAALSEPRALTAHYDPVSGMVELALANGCLFAFPAAQAEGLKGAPPDVLGHVEILGNGYALRWPELDADFTVPGLLAGRLGSRRWMAEELGRAGGRARSAAKARAARENGRKGGRPSTSSSR